MIYLLLTALAVAVSLAGLLWLRWALDRSRHDRESREMLIHLKRSRNGC